MSISRVFGINNKFVIALLICVLFVCFFNLSALADTGINAAVTAMDVNVRTAPSVDSDVYKRVNIGTVVIAEELNGDFYRVALDGGSYYIHKDFLAPVTGQGMINNNSVNIRKYPSKAHEILSQVELGDTFDVTGSTGDWVNIIYGKEGAFVHKDYIDVANPAALREIKVVIPEDTEVALGLVSSLKNQYHVVVNSPAGLRLRSQPSSEAKVVTSYAHGTALDYLADYGDWVKVARDGFEGYMSSDFITIKSGQRPQDSLGQRIVDYAGRFRGTPYVWGGTSLTSGVDCSGFVYSVYKNFGITLNRTSRYQYSNGYPVKKAELQLGDLVFFDTDNDGGISHVGIYIGGGRFIHSSSGKSSMCVTVSSLSEAYYVRTYKGACRVI